MSQEATVSPTRRVLVRIEPGRAGAGALDRARALARSEPTELTLVAIAPQATGPRCGTSIRDYNRAVIEAAREDLARARASLSASAARVCCQVLVEGLDPPLEELVARGAFDHVVLPARARGWPWRRGAVVDVGSGSGSG